MQRARFKKDSKNQGKPYTGGLWATSRHINYFGYMLWRSGYALAAGGWIFGGVIASFFAYDFITRTIPALEDYCEHRVSPPSTRLTPSQLADPYAVCGSVAPLPRKDTLQVRAIRLLDQYV